VIRHRVLHVVASAHRHVSGIAQIIAVLAKGLDPRGYDLECLFLQPGPMASELARNGLPAHVIRWDRTPSDIPGSWAFLRFLARHRYSIIHAHVGNRVVLLPAKLTGAAVVLHAHSNVIEALGEQPVVVDGRSADYVLAVSESVSASVRAKRVTVVRPGIEVAETACHGDPSGPLTIGTAGRLVRVKGIAHLIAAFAAVRKQFPEARLEIAGDGPDLDLLQRLTSSLQLQPWVSFLGWVDNLAPLFRRWNIFAQPSLQDAAPLSLLEAAAASLPVVGTHTGGIPEMIEDGVTGYLVPPGDEAALAAVLVHLLRNPQHGLRLGEAGRTLVANKFSCSAMVAGTVAVYDRLCHRSPDRPGADG